MPKGFITAESNKGLVWDNNKQAYTYKGKAVDYSNVYVIDGKIGVFTNKEGTKVYTGTVYGKNNEILMTVKDKDNNFYSYWAAEVKDPSATMATYRVEEYEKNLAVLEENDNRLSRDDIKKVTLTKGENFATIGLMRNGDKAVDGAITVTSGGGTGGSGAAHDTFVKISNGTTEQTFATGSKVEAIGSKDATTGIKINGEDYTIKSGSVVSVAQNTAEKTTTITVDGKATTITDTDTHNALKSASLSGKTLTITGKDDDSVNVDLSSIDTDTKYTAGNGITISGENNAIAVKLKEGENNLEVTEAGLELKKALTVNSVKAGEFYMSNAGIGYGDKAYITSSGLNANSHKITGVAAGTADTDAVNVAQLKKVSEAAASASQGWKLKTQNGNASDVKPGATVEFDGDANIQVGNDGNKVSVTLKKQLTGIQSITGAGEGAGSISFANGGIKFNNKVTINSDGKITGVAAGTEDTDAVNLSQLNAVKETANKGWTLSTNGGEASKVAAGAKVDFSGDDNIKVSNIGTNVKVELNKELTGLTSVTTNKAYVTKVDASNNKSVTNVEYVKNQIADAALSAGNGISITDKKINVKLKDGEENLKVDETGLYLRKDLTGMESITGVGGGKISFATGGNVTINNTTFNNDGRIQGVEDGKDAKDAVNFSQLQAVKSDMQASDKHLVGNPASADGSYKPDANGDISLRVEDSKNNGYNVVIKDVAKASDVGNVNDIADDLKNGGEGKTTVVDAVNNLNNKLDKKVGDLNYVEGEAGTKGNYVTNGESTTVSIGKLDQALKDVADTAAKHTTVTQGDNITVIPETNTDGSQNYEVTLNKDLTDLNSVTASKANIGGVSIENNTVNNLSNKNWDAKNTDQYKDSGKAATEAQLQQAMSGTVQYDRKDDGTVNKTQITLNKEGDTYTTITNVADGKVEKDSKDAINGGQLHQAKADINHRIDGVENQVISNSNRIGQLSSRVNKVGAGAAALAALHPMDFDPDDKLTFSAGYGNYAGQNAAAIGAYYRPDEKVMFSVGGTVGNGENMVNAGVSFALDRTNHVSNSRTALAREVIDLRGQLAVMGAKMAKMEKALGMLDETKTKLFPDIPANHWAYEYIAKLAGNGYIEGYPDGNFGGDRLMTRYEFAAMLYRAIENGAALEEKIIKEFEPELGRIRVDRISGEDGDRDKIERVRVNDTKGERDHYGNKLAK